MNAKIKSWACVLIVSLGLGTWAAVVPYVKNLYPRGDAAVFSSLSVPAGKVVVFEYMQSTARVVTFVMNYSTVGSGIDSVTGVMSLSITNPNPNYIVALPSPFLLRGGWLITNVTTSGIFLFGKAMDDDDLYAGVGSEIDSLGLTGGALQAGVQLDSPRPVVTRVERSEDLKTWAPDDGVVIHKVADPARLEFEADSADPGSFFRVNARARTPAE